MIKCVQEAVLYNTIKSHTHCAVTKKKQENELVG